MVEVSVCLCMIFAFYVTPIHSQQLTDVRRLIQDKELNYDSSIRPVMDQSNPITVYVGFFLVSINGVNELQQTITLNAIFLMAWIDEQMKWNSSDYGSLQTLTVESSRFWTPPMVSSNTVERLTKIGDPWLHIRYYANGTANYFPGVILTASCQLDIRFYPLDRHVCFLAFNPWGFLPNEYFLQNISSEIDISKYTPNGVWNLIATRTDTVLIPNIYVAYTVAMVIERQPAYIIVNIILPVIVLVVLNLMTFFVPSDSGERLSFSITLLLAIAVFLTIVSDNLPKTSTSIAVLSYSLLTALIISTCITIVTVYSLRLSHRDQAQPVAGCWQWIVRVTRCRTRTKKRRKSFEKGRQSYAANTNHRKERNIVIAHSEVRVNPFIVNHERPIPWTSHGDIKSMLSGTKNGTDLDTTVPTSGEVNKEDRECKHDVDGIEKTVTWEEVSVIFDMICFTFFCIALSILFVVTIGIISNGIESPDELLNRVAM
ncbi:hypothetical protein ACF0H5_008093 [Mactra antiquata]